MKKTKLLLLLLFCALAITLCLTACSKTVQSISIKEFPTKVNYTVGETILNLEGGVINVNYSSGKPTELPMTSEKVEKEGFNTSTEGEVTITLTYSGFKTSFKINVLPVETSVEIVEIKVTKAPTKTLYTFGDTELDIVGGEITVYFDDESEEVVPMSFDQMEFDYDFSVSGERIVTVKYEDFEAEFTVTVEDEIMPYVLDLVYMAYLIENAWYHFFTYNPDTRSAYFLYFYYTLLDEVELLYAYGTEEDISNYLAEIYYDGGYPDGTIPDHVAWLTNSFNILFGSYYSPEVIEFTKPFVKTLYNYENTENFYGSDKFNAGVLDMIDKYALVSPTDKVLLFTDPELENGYTDYHLLMCAYYQQYLTPEEYVCYRHYLDAETFYYFSKYTGTRQESFMSSMEKCMGFYDALSDSTAFDGFFKTEYELYLSYYNELLDPKPVPPEVTAIIDFLFSQDMSNATYIIATYGDFTLLSYYFPIAKQMVDDLYESGDQDAIDYFESMFAYGVKVIDYYNSLAELANEFFNVFEDTEAYDFWYDTYLAIALEWFSFYDSVATDRSMYPEFDDDMEMLLTASFAMSTADQLLFNSYNAFFFMSMYYDHYIYIFSEDQSYVTYQLLFAFYECLLYIEGGEETTYWFDLSMEPCIELYEALSEEEKISFNAYACGDMYAFCKETYDGGGENPADPTGTWTGLFELSGTTATWIFTFHEDGTLTGSFQVMDYPSSPLTGTYVINGSNEIVMSFTLLEQQYDFVLEFDGENLKVLSSDGSDAVTFAPEGQIFIRNP